MEARRCGGEDLALGDFCNFLIKITQFLRILAKIAVFKVLTHKLKAFEKQSKRTK